MIRVASSQALDPLIVRVCNLLCTHKYLSDSD